MFDSTPKSILVISMLVLVVTALPASSREPVPAASKIVEVTVYRDRAEVVKEATVQLPAGASSVEFVGLPFGVEQDTLRVSALGVSATLGAIKIRQRADDPVEAPEWLAAQSEVLRLEEEIAALEQSGRIDGQLRGFLKSVTTVTASREARDLGEGQGNPAAISEVYTLLETKLGSLGRAGLERHSRRRELDKELAVARARLNTLRPGSGVRSRSAVVEIETERAGSLTLRLAYLAPGASWRPSYRATLDAASGDVALVSEGVVRQGTGEDWTDVQLRLSSASPASGVQPPMLSPWILRPAVAFGRAQGVVAGMSKPKSAPARAYQNTLALAPGSSDQEGAPAEPAAHSQAEIVRSAYNVAFGVLGRSTVPADGSDHRVVLRQEMLKSNLVHRTVPGLDPRAYLTAVTTSPADYPLLAGPVRVFAGGAYLGSFPLLETGPGVELTLPFGVDNRIEIVRVPDPQMESREGISGKFRLVERTKRTLLHNLLDHDATVVVEERMPVSENERIEVELGKETTVGFKDSARRPGVKIWTLTLAAGEKRTLQFDYSVRYPRELQPPNL